MTPAFRRLRVAGLVALFLIAPTVIRAIYVSPTTVFIDERSRSTQITVGNPGERPEEASVELRFGFPDADSAGTPYIRFVDDPGPEFPSAADWIRAFPQRMRVEPGTQQLVRLLARPPEGLPDGEYWARVIVTGRGAAVDITSGAGPVRAGVSLETRLITTVIFRKGRVTTGIEVRNLAAEAEGDSLAVWANLARQGNAAWHGTVDVELTRGRGPTMRRWSVPIAVYYPLRRRFAFPLQSLDPGDYLVRLRLRAERPDLPAERVLRAPTVFDSVAVRVL